ncbi:glycosyl hydrolase [Alisedimentitalea sp. MJ-SS2]|uniref:glycosyl hydrolase n=1 Tax=Aliisedimentitalea sp. MJ-SS2 TaxID=3049795 RepID=UPI002906DDCB|nr:glycosyl hydrolase [Alisedimentitalea sp. MJ-SS2]MDU8928592.1 glycosyl hydrolase [Alisedimentitalea sp. MJ-SS2]
MLRTFAFLIGFMMTAMPALAQKVGVGAWENGNRTTLDWIEDRAGLSWYYNWRTDHIWHKGGTARTVEFVPMIHSAKDVNKRITSSRRVKALLGFNEPDQKNGKHQAGMSVQEAIRLWPKLEKRGLRLGSPATTQGQTLGKGSWQRRFMTEADKRGLRVDFMAVHYYSTNGDVRAFRKWLQAVHREYKRPIWVTEFAMINWSRPGAVTYEQNARFATEAIAMMEALPYVERHAWFAANPYPWKGRTPRINLVDAKMNPTPVGRAFDRVLARFGARKVAGANP